MAKLECELKGPFTEIIGALDHEILQGSMSASLEGKSDYVIEGIRCAVRVYERYSMMGGNRLSMNITLVGNDETSHLVAITAGGSQAVLFKINTWGEEAFLDCISHTTQKYKK
ncbi:MAG: DUF6054 family protein [Cellulosilyticaceae bacterium]